MSKIKAVSKAALLATIETVATGASNMASKATRHLRNSYWTERAVEMRPIIEACPNCSADCVMTGYYANKAKDKYCDKHQKEALKIIWRFNNSLP